MSNIVSITPKSLEPTFATESGKNTSITFRNASQMTEADLNALLRHDEKPVHNTTLPRLPEPQPDANPTDAYAIPLSMGATVMGLITKIAGEARRGSADQRALELNSVIAEIHHQADEIREKGDQQFKYAIISASITIGVGLATAGVGAFYAPAAGAGTSEKMVAAKMSSMATFLGSVNSIAGGVTGGVQGLGAKEVALIDEQIKRREAEQERIRARIEQLRTTEESLLDLMRKAIATQDAIQQNTNQTRTKILG